MLARALAIINAYFAAGKRAKNDAPDARRLATDDLRFAKIPATAPTIADFQGAPA